MRAFVRRYLDQSTRLGEVLFGLIMAMGITGAVRFGSAEANNRELFIAVLGCNIAWGIVDGVMFAMLGLFERSRRNRIIKRVTNASTDQAAISGIREEIGGQLERLISPAEQEQVFRWVLENARNSRPDQPGFCRDDVLGGIAITLLILVATLPVVLPFALISNATTAVRLSNTITVCMLFGIGWWWGRTVGTNPLQVGAAIAGIGFVLVLITIALGG